jgi:hypothetical protein
MTSKREISTKQLLVNGVLDQLDLLNDINKDSKGKPIQSWFTGLYFSPKVANQRLFQGAGFVYNRGTELDVLNHFKRSLERGEFDKDIARVDKAREANAAKLASARNKLKAKPEASLKKAS